MKIIIVDKMTRFTTKQVKELQKLGEVMFTPLNKNVLSNLPKKVYADEVILVPDPDVFDWKIKNKELKKFKKLQAICLPTTSFEMFDTVYCKKNNITITNIPNYSTEAVAEYAIWMMLSLVRKLPLMAAGKIDVLDDNSIQEETKGKVMGIIGLGAIGERIAEYGDRMAIRVIYWSRTKKDTLFQKATLKKLLKTADYIFPCYEINKDTQYLLDKQLLKLMKSNAYFISINRKEGFDAAFLIKQVRAKKLAGFAYEVDKSEKIASAVNIFTPPPVAWFTKESRERCYEMLTETIVSVNEGNLKNRVC